MRLTRNLLAGFALLLATQAQVAAQPAPVCPELADQTAFPDGNERMLGTFEGKDGWYSSPYELTYQYSLDDPKWLANMSAALRSAGTQLVVLVMPTRPMLYPEMMPDGAQSEANLAQRRAAYHQLIRSIQQTNTLTVDALEVFDKAIATQDVYFANDHHWTPYGAQSIAEALADVLKSDVSFPNSGVAFRQLDEGEFEAPASFLEAIEQQCGKAGLPHETFTKTVVEKIEDAGATLLGDAPPPSIVLAGTSFSGERWDFAGRLALATGEEVLNVSITGGGAYAALMDYLASAAFAEAPPRYLIWERANTFPTPSNGLTAQLLGSIAGSCELDAIVSIETAADDALRINLEGFAPPVTGLNYRLELRYDDRTARRVMATFVGADGRESAYPLTLPEHAAGSGAFFAELPRDRGDIASILVSPHDPLSGNLRARICGDRDLQGAEAPLSRTTGETSEGATATDSAASALSAGELILKFDVTGHSYSGSPILAIEVNGRVVDNSSIDAAIGSQPQTVSVPVAAGARVRIRLANDLYDGPGKDRNLQIESASYDGKRVDLEAFAAARPASMRLLNSGAQRLVGDAWVVVSLPTSFD